MEKKLMITLLAVTMVLGFSSLSMSGGHHGFPGGGFNFVDDNGDGICDNGGSGCGLGDCPDYVDENADGYCDHSGRDRNSFRRNNKGNREGTPRLNLFDGEPFSYKGEVISIGSVGGGMVIKKADDAEVTVYGIAPIWFWDCNNVSRPVVGDVIDITGYTVEYNDLQRTIAASITIDGDTIDLRDPDTGFPLWRGGSRWLLPINSHSA